MELIRLEKEEIASNCWVKSRSRFVVSLSWWEAVARGVGVADTEPLLRGRGVLTS